MASSFYKTTFGLGLVLAFSAAAHAESVTVAKHNGSLQCESIGISLKTMRKELKQAKIPSKRARCASDGMIYPTVCGGETGRLNLFDIPEKKLEQAAALGFQPLSDFPDAAEVPCEKKVDFSGNAAAISINGIGPAVDGKAFDKVRKLIGQAVEDSVLSRFIVYGYGVEGGFSSCVQEGQFAPEGAFNELINKLQAISFDSTTTAFSVNAIDECVPE